MVSGNPTAKGPPLLLGFRPTHGNSQCTKKEARISKYSRRRGTFTTTLEPTDDLTTTAGKMKYIHSEETLEVPEGGMCKFYGSHEAARRERTPMDAIDAERFEAGRRVLGWAGWSLGATLQSAAEIALGGLCCCWFGAIC